jgi:hypothetical protein
MESWALMEHRNPPYSRRAGLFCQLMLVSICIGCSAPDETGSQQGTAKAEKGVRPSVESAFGVYAVTDYVRYRGGLTPESWAQAQIGKRVALSKDSCESLLVRIKKPRYDLKLYEPLPEGEVPSGERRLLTDFYGLGAERKGVYELEVHGQGEPEASCDSFEIIDRDTLWTTYDGWALQLKREGTSGLSIPLKDRMR